jgi:putative DNA primase/helicase
MSGVGAVVGMEEGSELVAKLAHELGGGKERQQPDGSWLTLCPAHLDRNPSLSLKVGDKVPVLWICRVGCSQDAVGDALKDCGRQRHNSDPIAFRPPATTTKKKVDDNWVIVMPVPEDAPVYQKSSNASMMWTYRDADGRILGHVERVEPRREDERKQFYPKTIWLSRKTGALRWDSKAFPEPRPLYGLWRLAQKPDAPVLIVAGEKCAEAGERCVAGYLSVSASGGERKRVTDTDWAPLNGRNVTIWGDHDDTGIAFADAVKAHLIKLDSRRTVRVIGVPDDYPRKFDIADAEDGSKGKHWSPFEIETFVKTLCVPQDRVLGDRNNGTDRAAENKFFVVLGHDANTFFFRRRRHPQVLEVPARSMGPNDLLSLAPLTYWEARYASKSGVNWKAAISDLMELGKPKLFRKDDIRGRGAWIDGQRIVLHLGESLWVDGHQCTIDEFPKPEGMYEVGRRIPLELNVKPLAESDSRKVLELIKKCPWSTSLSAYLLTGWIVTAPFSGILEWRPHIWVTGESDSGKSRIFENVLPPLMPFRYTTTFSGVSTEAGIRQALGNDLLPILFEEAEGENVKNVIALMRGTSSGWNNKIVKGTPGGRPVDYALRTSSALGSIYVRIKETPDLNRIARLELIKRADRPWKELVPKIKATFTPEFGASFFKRLVGLAPTLRKNITTFQDAVAVFQDDGRAGQLYGTLIAGAYMSVKSDVISPAGATKFVQSLEWDADHGESIEVNLDQFQCLNSILGAQVSILIDQWHGNFVHVNQDKRTIGELIEQVLAEDLAEDPTDNPVEKKDKRQEPRVATLARFGIRVGQGTGKKDDQTEGRFVWVANRNDGLSKVIGDHPWSQNGWAQYLARLDGAVKSGSEPKKFAGSTQPWVALPAKHFV